MKVVLDSNVVIAAFTTQGLCHLLFQHCLDRNDLIWSDQLLEETGRFLDKKVKIPAARVHEILGFLRAEMKWVYPHSVPSSACRDSDDGVALGTALAGKADVIVTGDQDLLVLKEFRSIPILSPRNFLFPRK